MDERTLMSYLSSCGYKNPSLCCKDILNSIKHYRGLTPRKDTYMFNNGTNKELVCLSGTIPVPYKGAMYNIPVSLWILDTFPMHAPMCYVCPTPDMQIRVSKHVDHNGKIYLPYLHEWKESNSDLLGLIQICIVVFSELPPVFAKSSQPPPQQQQPQQPPMYPPYPTSSAQNFNSYQNQTSTITEEHLKASLISAVEDKVRRLLREEFSAKQGELESLRKIRDELQNSSNSLKATLESMKSETNNLDRYAQELNLKKTELESKHSVLDQADTENDIDMVVTVPYPLYNQLLNAYAEDSAIEDSIYYFGEALRMGKLDCDSFLKVVRNSSRKQFFQRLTAIKCRNKAKLD